MILRIREYHKKGYWDIEAIKIEYSNDLDDNGEYRLSIFNTAVEPMSVVIVPPFSITTYDRGATMDVVVFNGKKKKNDNYLVYNEG